MELPEIIRPEVVRAINHPMATAIQLLRELSLKQPREVNRRVRQALRRGNEIRADYYDRSSFIRYITSNVEAIESEV